MLSTTTEETKDVEVSGLPSSSSMYQRVSEVEVQYLQAFTNAERKEDVPMFNLLWERKGSVFGGWLRDVIAGDTPKDVDVVLSTAYAKDFIDGMHKLGYISQQTSVDELTSTRIFTKPDTLPVEMIEMDDDPDEILLGPAPDPDFDVNLLAWNGKLVYNWMDPDPFNISDVVKHIQARQAVPIMPSETRMEKIMARGYTIL